MKRKKLLAMFLAVMMLAAVCGCGETTVEAYDDGVGPALAEPLDFDAAWAAHDPEEIIFYVDGDGVTWREFFYQIAYYASYISAAEGAAITSWDDACSLVTDEQGNYISYGALVLQNAVNLLQQYHIMYRHLTDAGIVLGKEGLDQVDLTRQAIIDQSFDGNETAFLEYLNSIYCTEELWTWFTQVDALYSFDGFETFFGDFGSDISDEDVMVYAAGSETGGWTEYVQLRQIYLYDEDPVSEVEAEQTADASGEATEEPSAEPEAAETSVETAEKIAAAIGGAEDKNAAFDEQYALYNEEPGLDIYSGTNGWCLYEGDTYDKVYQAALAMEDYDVQTVEMDGGAIVVMKVPLEPDACVYYDAENDVVYTLRYYAAWQAYGDMINEWMASAQVTEAEGFEGFTLNDVF